MGHTGLVDKLLLGHTVRLEWSGWAVSVSSSEDASCTRVGGRIRIGSHP